MDLVSGAEQMSRWLDEYIKKLLLFSKSGVASLPAGCRDQPHDWGDEMSTTGPDLFSIGTKAAFVALIGICAMLLSSSNAIAAPVVEGQSVSGVTSTSATLEARINPGDIEYPREAKVAPITSSSWSRSRRNTGRKRPAPKRPPKGRRSSASGPYGTVDGPPPLADIQRRPGDLPTVFLLGGPEGQVVRLALADIGRALQPATRVPLPRAGGGGPTVRMDTVEI